MGTSTQILFGIFVIPAIVFALAYFPAVTQLSRGLTSPYAKADVRRRLFAATIDGLLVVMTCVLSWNSESVLYVVGGGIYLLLRDAMRGQSVGKFLMGLVVISLETGRPSTLFASVRRNLLLLLPGANVVAVFLEAGTIVRDPQGQRLGDRLAQTQVVEGLGAKDLVKSFQDSLMTSLGDELGRSVDKPDRALVEIDRRFSAKTSSCRAGPPPTLFELRRGSPKRRRREGGHPHAYSEQNVTIRERRLFDISPWIDHTPSQLYIASYI